MDLACSGYSRIFTPSSIASGPPSAVLLGGRDDLEMHNGGKRLDRFVPTHRARIQNAILKGKSCSPRGAYPAVDRFSGANVRSSRPTLGPTLRKTPLRRLKAAGLPRRASAATAQAAAPSSRRSGKTAPGSSSSASAWASSSSVSHGPWRTEPLRHREAATAANSGGCEVATKPSTTRMKSEGAQRRTPRAMRSGLARGP